MKICNKCKEEKELTEFHKHRKYKDGLNISCKVCSLEQKRRYYEKNRERILCDVKLYRDNNIDKVRESVKKNYEKNRETLLEYKKEYHNINKDRMVMLNKKYYEENKEIISLHKKEYITNKRKTDKLFKLKERISGLILSSIKSRGYKKNERTEKILGCTIIEFKHHLESKFLDGMCWDNQGTWHLDHIRPVSWANDEYELLELNHFTNFQPLWSHDNLSKGNRWEG